MRLPLAVHLDIRPRLSFPAEPRASARRRWRLPPLALPALGYWLAMAALTYGFTRLGPNPLDPAAPPQQAALPLPAVLAPAAAPTETEAPPSLPEPPSPAEETPSEPEPTVDRVAAAPRARQREPEPEAARATPRREEAPDPEVARGLEPPPSRPALDFPEFTDSTRPAARVRVADGPRIDSLFERADERPSPGPAPEAPPSERAPSVTGPALSCEAAIARNNEQLTIGAARGAPDISREAYASILQNGRYLAGCAIPERSVFEICAAVQNGRAIGITVVSSPASPALNACVRSAVARLQFPSNSRLDVTHTRFDATRR